MEETEYSEGEILEKRDCTMSEEKESQIKKKKIWLVHSLKSFGGNDA